MSALKFDREALLKRLQEGRPKLELVEVKGLGAVYLRRQNGEDVMAYHAIKTEFSKEQLDAIPTAVLAALLGSVMLRNEDGTPFFENASEGYKQLIELRSDVLNDLLDRILEIAGLDNEALENAEKKSSRDQSSEPGSN